MTRRRCWLAIVAALAACQPADDGPGTQAAHITVTSGDAQLGDANDVLPRPVQFLVTDSKSRPVPGISVQFTVTVGAGTVPESAAITDSAGRVETQWTMGAIGDVGILEARIDSRISATASAVLCLPNECYPESRVSGPLSDATTLDLTTYEGSGQTIHPDVVAGHYLVRGFWLALTPYPGGNIAHENPSIFHGTDGISWQVPAGVSNPLVHAVPPLGYLSDPDIVYNPTDHRLWLFYRAVSDFNNIELIRSSDGVHWDSATTVFKAPNHQAVSPTVVRGAPHAPWSAWTVNAGKQGCTAVTTTIERRTSTDGLHWSTPVTVDLVQPGQAIWHLDVEWIPARAEYWAIYNTYAVGSSCATPSLYIARSDDGMHWSVMPSPIARAGMTDDLHDIIYRSTLLANPKGTRLTLWVSGAKFLPEVGYIWRTATVSTTPGELLAIAGAPNAGISAPLNARKLPPPEPDIAP